MAATGSKSRKRLDPSSNSKLLKSPVFFLDRSLGRKKVAHALRQVGAQVETHEDHFSANAKDEQWLGEVGQKGWVVLTKDRHIRYRAPEVAALMTAGVAAFVLTGGNLTGDEMAALFQRALPAIQKFLITHRPPFIAKVSKRGAVSMLFPAKKR
jgi:predicted nuclease of predicted toxin-antitoxin system